jgi:hypothetical protein
MSRRGREPGDVDARGSPWMDSGDGTRGRVLLLGVDLPRTEFVGNRWTESGTVSRARARAADAN